MKKEKNWTKWVYWFTLGVALIFVYKTISGFENIFTTFSKFFSVASPFFLAVLLAYLFYIPCRAIERLYKKTKMSFKLARFLSVITVYILAILLIVLILNIALPAISKGVMELANSLPAYYDTAISLANDIPEDSIISKEYVQGIITQLEAIDITQFISLENIYDYIIGLLGVANAIFGVIITVILSIYMLLERNDMINFVKRLTRALFKEETSNAIIRCFNQGNEIFFKFISSQVLDGIIVGILAGIIMWIMGIKHGALLALLIGVFNLIPVLGAIVAIGIAAVITLITGGFTQSLWLLVVIIILQQIDSNIINPKLIGRALEMSPILVLFGVTVFGAYTGIVGMFLAVPIIGIVKLLIEEFIESKIGDKKEQET